MDVLIFSGQSNMQGQTEALPSPNDPVDGAFEYRFADDSLVALQHPCGEFLGGDLLLGADSGHGCMVPDFCREYVRLTGRRVTAIHAAKGGSSIGEWQKGGERYALAVKKMRAGIEKARELEPVEHVYLIWHQGESDAINHTSEDEYVRLVTAFKDGLKADVGIERFGIAKVGYLAGVVFWLTDRTREEGKKDDEIIMSAQERLCAEDGDFVMLSRLCPEFSLNEEYLSPFAPGHFNNKAFKLIGEDAARTLASL